MNYYEIVGRYFGYPECCIKDFMSRDEAPEEKRQLCGSGYIPCPDCNNKETYQILIEINRNRVHYEPFPLSDTSEELLDFFASIATDFGGQPQED